MSEYSMDDYDLELLHEIMEDKPSDEMLAMIYERIVKYEP